MIDVRPMILFICVYIGLGRWGGEEKDFFYVGIPQPLRKLFYVKELRRLSYVTYEEYIKLPLKVVIAQAVCLIYSAIWLVSTLYSVVTGIDTSHIYEVAFAIGFFALIAVTIYTCICDLFLRVLKKNR